MSGPTLTWWSLLCTVALLNLLGWAFSVAMLRRRAGTLGAGDLTLTRWQVVLSAGYVLGCGYRSVFPVFDVQRLVIVDSWLSSVIVGRSVATVAELCFAAQWALLLRGVSLATHSAAGLAISRLILPLIVVAEVCSWHAVLTTANLGHVLEESLWGISAALLVASLAIVWPRCKPAARPALAAAAVAGIAYVAYMAGVDVPMYWERWLADLAQQRPFLSVAQGVADASQRWVVSHHWADWRSEVVWMTLYFSVAVWLSIGLMHLPALFAGNAQAPRRRPDRLGALPPPLAG